MFNHPARLIIPCSLYHPTRLQHIVVLDAYESVCTWLSDRALLKTPPPGSFLHEIQKQQLQKRPAHLSRLPGKGKALMFPKHSRF